MFFKFENFKVFAIRFSAGVFIAVGCFYCIIEIAWPEVCKMQVQYNERKSSNKAKESSNPKGNYHLKVAFKNKISLKPASWKQLAFYDNAYKSISKSQLRLLEFLELHYGSTFFEKDIFPVFTKNVSVKKRNMSTFFRWLSYLEGVHLIKVQSGEISLTQEGKEFLQQVRQKKHFISCSN